MTSPDYGPKPEMLANRSGRTVGGALRSFIDHAAEGLAGSTRLDIASAYFNVGGHAVLGDSLDRVDSTRLLLGAEPQQGGRRRRVLRSESANPRRAQNQRLRRALKNSERQIIQERDLMGFSHETDKNTERLIGWLRSSKVRVRRLEDRFLHGKAFLVGSGAHGVVAGSSNFTRAGLTTNAELNIGSYSPHVVGAAQEWFDELWDAAADYDAAALFEPCFVPHSPYHVYLRMLWELYGDEIEEETQTAGLPLTGFQTDGVLRAKRFLAEHDGVLIADEVGLGKTFLAGELIREAAVMRRQRVLVVAPAALRDGPWKAFRSEHNLPMELASFEDLTSDCRLNPAKPSPKLQAGRVNDYAMVVVDEAHNLRNPSTLRADAMRRLLAGSPPKKLVLLTATPVNNSLWDLYYLLGYFLRSDSVFASSGIGSLRKHFAEAMKTRPSDLSPSHLFDVLDAVAVRRTRSFVRAHYSNDTIIVKGREQPIRFPEPRVMKVSYDMDGVLPGFFDRLRTALSPDLPHVSGSPQPASGCFEGVLTLARYSPSRYLLDRAAAPKTYEMTLSGLLRSVLLKRFESSPHAFASTCEKMADSCDAFLRLLAEGRVGTGRALTDWAATDSDDTEEIGRYLDEHQETDNAAGYDTEQLTTHVAHDRDLLKDFAAAARTVTRASDPTLLAVTDELAGIASQARQEGNGAADIRDRRKVLIFTYYADTVEWIYRHLTEIAATDPRLADYHGRVAAQTGRSSRRKRDVLWGFAPATTDAPEGSDTDLYDILVTTDVLAEGVNLQQARHIINYDLPWNPMRLVQRHGRIDRIGSPHSEVFIRCVFPDDRLDDLLGLEKRLQHKIRQAAASVGAPAVLPETDTTDRDFAETREEIERLRQEDSALLVRGGTETGAASGEEFRQELRRRLADPVTRNEITGMPWGSGSAMRSPRIAAGRVGFVFCIRVGDHPEPQFRYTETTRPPAADSITVRAAGKLGCLTAARPPEGPETPNSAQSDNDAKALRLIAIEAWQRTLRKFVKDWNYYADKANLESPVNRTLRQASETIRSHPPPGLAQTGIDKAVDTLQTGYTERTVRAIRNALRSSNNPRERSRQILDTIERLGLRPPEHPDPLPVITANDAHLVCWQALTPP